MDGYKQIPMDMRSRVLTGVFTAGETVKFVVMKAK